MGQCRQALELGFGVCGEEELRWRGFSGLFQTNREWFPLSRSLCRESMVFKRKGKKKERKKELELKHAERLFFFFKKKFCIEFVAILLRIHAFVSWLKGMHAGSQLPNQGPNLQSPNHWITREVLRVLGVVGKWRVRPSIGFRVFKEVLSSWNILDRTIWGVEVEGTGTV